jgi:hypothetical protein
MIYTGGGSFFLSDEALLASPSRADGVDVEIEFKLRCYGAEMIQAGGALLRLYVAPSAAALLRCGCVLRGVW